MFNRPNKNDPPSVVADSIELQCFIQRVPISANSMRSLYSMPDDEIKNDGIESSDDYSIETLEDGIKVCNQRSVDCPAGYPFDVTGNTLSLHAYDSLNKEIYEFLLLATRLDMREESRQGGHNATKLFEELCAIVAAEYFGQHSKSMVFGTAESCSFQNKVEQLIKSLNLTSVFRTPLGSTGRQKDAAVDVIAWIPFTDKKDSQMIAIGQCKTGTHWENMLTATQPKVFFGSYFSGEPFADVERMFFMSESYGMDRWEERSRKAGIVFDRTRIMEFLPVEFDTELLEKIMKWNKAALTFAEKKM